MAADHEDSRWRKLHMLSGAAILGLFLVEHLVTNASALAGQAAYDSVIEAAARSRLLVVFELVVLVPLFFHAGYGLYLLSGRAPSARSDASIDRYGDRRLWVVQRASATFVLVFVLAHLWELRVQRLFFGMSPDALHTTLAHHLSFTWIGIPWIALGYLLGLLATLFHFGNGLSVALVSWNVMRDAPARRRGIIVALGVVLFLIGGATVVSFATGTRLLPAADADSAPCGTAFKPPAPPIPPPSASF